MTAEQWSVACRIPRKNPMTMMENKVNMAAGNSAGIAWIAGEPARILSILSLP